MQEIDIKQLAIEMNEFFEKYNKDSINEIGGNVETGISSIENVLTNTTKEKFEDLKKQFSNFVYDENIDNDLKNTGESVLAKLVQLGHEKFDFSKRLGEYTSSELKNMKVNELHEHLKAEISRVRFDDDTERQEFFKFLSGFNSAGYSFRNTLLLYAQANVLGCSPVFGTMKEWNKLKTSIKPGAKAMMICMPQKFEIFTKTNENGVEEQLPYTFDRKEYEERMRKVASGELKVYEKISFFYKNCIFSIDQTRLPEQDRVKYLQRYNGHNTSEKNLVLLEREKEIINKLGIELKYEDTYQSLGFVDASNWNRIVLHDNMPIDAQLSVLTHELGHWVLQRHHDINPDGYDTPKDEMHPYALTRKDMELQAQLFSHLVLEGLGVDSESRYSTKYISEYLSYDKYSKKEIKLSDANSEALYAHLNIVYDIAKKLTQCVSKQEIKQEDIDELKNFEPDRFVWDSSAKKAIIVSCSEAKELEAEKDNNPAFKNDSLQKEIKNKKSRKQHKTQQMQM